MYTVSLWALRAGLKGESQELVYTVLMRKGQEPKGSLAALPLQAGAPLPQPLCLGRPHNPQQGGGLGSVPSPTLAPGCVTIAPTPGPTYSAGYTGPPNCKHIFLN